MHPANDVIACMRESTSSFGGQPQASLPCAENAILGNIAEGPLRIHRPIPRVVRPDAPAFFRFDDRSLGASSSHGSFPVPDAHGQSKRSRGRPRGSKDRKPRKKRRHTTEASASSQRGDGDGDAGGARPVPGKKGRQKPWKIVLTGDDAREIYRSRATGKAAASACSRLALRYSVHAKTIRDIWNRETWTKATRQHWTAEEAEDFKCNQKKSLHHQGEEEAQQKTVHQEQASDLNQDCTQAAFGQLNTFDQKYGGVHRTNGLESDSSFRQQITQTCLSGRTIAHTHLETTALCNPEETMGTFEPWVVESAQEASCQNESGFRKVVPRNKKLVQFVANSGEGTFVGQGPMLNNNQTISSLQDSFAIGAPLFQRPGLSGVPPPYFRRAGRPGDGV
mmetsp:Transcript_18966/g.52188  ORF Transcript_18966/g.52188 Transcript_18966/m.52188 type:complete len:393 (-) Transcript_18966:6-1184(-)